MGLQDEVRQQVNALVEKARRHFGVDIPLPEVHFRVRGVTAGVARRDGSSVGFNLTLLSENTEAFYKRTIPHEVAHVVACRVFGPKIRPHGREWQSVMHFFGADPTRCHKYDVANARVRTTKKHPYRCACRTHLISTVRHNKIIRHGSRLRCRECQSILSYDSAQAASS